MVLPASDPGNRHSQKIPYEEKLGLRQRNGHNISILFQCGRESRSSSISLLSRVRWDKLESHVRYDIRLGILYTLRNAKLQEWMRELDESGLRMYQKRGWVMCKRRRVLWSLPVDQVLLSQEGQYLGHSNWCWFPGRNCIEQTRRKNHLLCRLVQQATQVPKKHGHDLR